MILIGDRSPSEMRPCQSEPWFMSQYRTGETTVPSSDPSLTYYFLSSILHFTRQHTRQAWLFTSQSPSDRAICEFLNKIPQVVITQDSESHPDINSGSLMNSGEDRK